MPRRRTARRSRRRNYDKSPRRTSKRKASRSRSPRRKSKAGRRRKTSIRGGQQGGKPVKRMGPMSLPERQKAFDQNTKLPTGTRICAKLQGWPWNDEKRCGTIIGFDKNFFGKKGKYRIDFDEGDEPSWELARPEDTYDDEKRAQQLGLWDLRKAKEKQVEPKSTEDVSPKALADQPSASVENIRHLDDKLEVAKKRAATGVAGIAAAADIQNIQEQLWRARRSKMFSSGKGWGNPGPEPPATPELAAGAAAPTAPAEGGFTVPEFQ